MCDVPEVKTACVSPHRIVELDINSDFKRFWITTKKRPKPIPDLDDSLEFTSWEEVCTTGNATALPDCYQYFQAIIPEQDTISQAYADWSATAENQL